MKRIVLFFAAVLTALVFAGCGKCPSFSQEEGEAYIREIFARNGKEIYNLNNFGTGRNFKLLTVRQTSEPNSHSDRRWYEIKYSVDDMAGDMIIGKTEHKESAFVAKKKGKLSLAVYSTKRRSFVTVE